MLVNDANILVIHQPTGQQKAEFQSGDHIYSNVVQLGLTDKNADLLVYPNPVHDVLNIQAPVQLSLHPRIMVIDLMGRVLLRQNLTGSQSKIQVSNLGAGIYFLI